MTKRPFLVFVICGAVVILIGIFLHFSNRKEWFYIDGEGPAEYHLYKGWQIILMGVAMLLLGLLLRWKSKSKKDDTELK